MNVLECFEIFKSCYLKKKLKMFVCVYEYSKINVKTVKNLKAICNNVLEKVQNPPQNVLVFLLMFFVRTQIAVYMSEVGRLYLRCP